jgi:hypothetical protein
MVRTKGYKGECLKNVKKAATPKITLKEVFR